MARITRNIKKQHLPQKICKTCGRPFSWRKKWERCWAEVLYCSDKCRSKKITIIINADPNHTLIFYQIVD